MDTDSHGDIKPPSPYGVYQEAMGLFEFFRLLRHFPDLAAQPKGSREPVLVIPGYGTSDRITGLLRFYLKHLNYMPMGWGLGRNNGKVPELLDLLAKKFMRPEIRLKQPINLIGWSLGGYLARELARDYPERVRQLITLGSPVIGGPKYTVTAGWYRRMGYDLDQIAAVVAERNKKPLTVPITAIYSKKDRIVSWHSCIDKFSSHIENIEVASRHIGMPFSPEVYRIIARQLSTKSPHPIHPAA